MATDKHLPLGSLTAVTLFSVALGAAMFAVYRLAHWSFGLPQLAVLVFLALLTATLLVWQESGLASDPKGFMFRFMVSLVVKLLVALFATAALLLLLPRERSVPLALTFASLYLAFLVFSTLRLSVRSRNAPRP